MHTCDIPEIAQLTTPEKILLVEDIWDSIIADETNVPVPQSHRDELDRRWIIHKSNPGRLLSLAELQAKINRRK